MTNTFKFEVEKLLACLGILLAASACGKNDDKAQSFEISLNPIIMKQGETIKLTVPNPRSIQWKVEDKDMASIDPDGNLTANLVGETEITANNGQEIAKASLKVLGNFNLYIEPIYGKDGITEEDVIKYEKETGRKFYKKMEFTDDSYILIFKTEEGASIKKSCYILSDKDGIVEQAWVEPAVAKEDVVRFIKERYILKEENKDTLTYQRGWVIIRISTINGSLNVRYMDHRKDK